MHDLKFIRDNPEAFGEQMGRRGFAVGGSARTIARMNRQKLLVEEYLNRRNILSAEIGRAMSKGGNPRPEATAEAVELARIIPEAESYLRRDEALVQELVAQFPNILADDVPDGADENDNVVVHTRGESVLGDIDLPEHDEVGGPLGMDFAAGVKLAGPRFSVLRGNMATLARALGQFMLDTHVREHGFTEIIPPVLVKDSALFGTGQFPKFQNDVFNVQHGDLWLAPTSEVMLTNLVADQMLDVGDLPLRFTALTECFRLEAGSAGRDTRGLIRQHQFQKVEMVSIVEPDKSAEEHERMTACAETILDKLHIPYRRLLLCAGDTGFSSRKTYDIEVWMAGAKKYREISSVSQCGDFQARRMGTRVKLDKKNKVFAHTLNGSGVAVGRALAAVVEWYQDSKGGVVVPDALINYMGGIEVIR